MYSKIAEGTICDSFRVICFRMSENTVLEEGKSKSRKRPRIQPGTRALEQPILPFFQRPNSLHQQGWLFGCGTRIVNTSKIGYSGAAPEQSMLVKSAIRARRPIRNSQNKALYSHKMCVLTKIKVRLYFRQFFKLM